MHLVDSTWVYARADARMKHDQCVCTYACWLRDVQVICLRLQPVRREPSLLSSLCLLPLFWSSLQPSSCCGGEEASHGRPTTPRQAANPPTARKMVLYIFFAIDFSLQQTVDIWMVALRPTVRLYLRFYYCVCCCCVFVANTTLLTSNKHEEAA